MKKLISLSVFIAIVIVILAARTARAGHSKHHAHYAAHHSPDNLVLTLPSEHFFLTWSSKKAPE